MGTRWAHGAVPGKAGGTFWGWPCPMDFPSLYIVSATGRLFFHMNFWMSTLLFTLKDQCGWLSKHGERSKVSFIKIWDLRSPRLIRKPKPKSVAEWKQARTYSCLKNVLEKRPQKSLPFPSYAFLWPLLRPVCSTQVRSLALTDSLSWHTSWLTPERGGGERQESP